ncbi:MAG: choice-of-anchor tandem repeat GloVer-containing protein [Bryobacteraceae bacterium]
MTNTGRCGCRTFASWLACGLAAAAMAQAQTSTEIVLHNFGDPPKGALPYAGVILDPAGNLYGTTYSGGTVDAGVVFKVSTAGVQTVLYNFTGGLDGGNPYGGVILDSAGNRYGTTYNGGTSGAGVVFKLDTAGRETVMYNFTGGADGGNPYAGVTLDPAGNLYGTTLNGGTANKGVVYKLDAGGQETVLHSFTGGADGSQPYAGVIRDSAGNLYGTTIYGGLTDNAGVVYRLDTAGHEIVMHSFTGGADGAQPYAGVIRDAAGNLYGTTYVGGGANQGVVYKLDPNRQETILFNFNTGGASPTTTQPRAGVIRDAAGNLYGTASLGGGPSSAGAVYKLDAAGNQTVLFAFTNGPSGGYPYAGVVQDPAGNLYGTTVHGGAANAGVVYKLDTAGNQTVLYSFSGPATGSSPYAGLIRDSAGNLYGTTEYGGPANQGVVYKVEAAGHETTLYAFTGGNDGGGPYGGVVRDSAGNLYGTTRGRGAAGYGVVYKLDPAGQETVLYTFLGGNADGANPTAGVVRDPAGNLYGTTEFGGDNDGGVVYKVDPAGHETVLHIFTGGADGRGPWGGLILDEAGNLYGTASEGGSKSEGVVFKIDTAGQETVLYNFSGGADGANPYSGVIRDSSGNLYGTTNVGGAANKGAVYKVDPAGRATVLYGFTGGADGGRSQAGVILDANGNIYGTTTAGGTAGQGVVFEIDAAGQETVLHSFTGAADGGDPIAGLVRDSAGNLYGTAYTGGTKSTGVVFKLTPP